MNHQLSLVLRRSRRAGSQRFDSEPVGALRLGRRLRCVFCVWMTLLAAPLFGDDGVIALINGKIVTMGDAGTFERGTLLVSGGVITAMGAELEVPDGARIIDCSGWTITPGLIDARSRLWMEPASATQSGGDASLDAFDALDRFHDDWQEVVRQGVTAVYVQPSGGDVCAGVGVVVAAAPLADDVDWILKRDAGLQTALGVGADLSGRGRLRQFERLKRLFTDAKKYQEDWAAYREYERKQQEAAPAPEGESTPAEGAGEGGDRRRGAGSGEGPGERGGEGTPPSGRRSGRQGGRGPATGDSRPPAQDDATPPAAQEGAESRPAAEPPAPPRQPEHDPIKERLVRVLQGEIPLRLEIRHPDEARRGLELANEFNLRLVCEGLTGTGHAAEALRATRNPLVLGPWVGSGRSARDVVELWNKSFREGAGRLVIATFAGTPRGSRWLRAHAASAVAAGCEEDVALAAITVHAAEVLGIADRVGSLAVGRRADLAVFAGDPLDVSVPVQLTLVAGQPVYDRGLRVARQPIVMDHGVADALPEQWPDRFAISSPQVLLPNGQIAARCLTIQDGVITSIEEGLPEAADFPVYRVSDHVLTPGLLIAHSTAGLSTGDYAAVESDGRQLVAVDGFDPGDRELRRLRAAGVLRLVLAPPSQLTLGGRLGVVRLGTEPEIVAPDVGDKIVLSGAARRNDQYPSSLLGQVELVRGLLNGGRATTRVYLPPAAQETLLAARRDGVAEFEGQRRWVLFEVSSDAETRAALDLIEAHGLRAALLGCQKIEPFLDRLLATRVTLIAQPPRETDYAWYVADLVRASDAGVPVLWTASSAESLRWGVAEAMAAGLEPQRALAGLTSQGATWLGFESIQAGLVVGAPADFVLWDGLPTDLRARATRVTVGGQVVESEGGE